MRGPVHRPDDALRPARAASPLDALSAGIPMKIEANRVVRFHYTVSEPGQPAIESSRDGGQPLAVLIGHGNIIEGLEEALAGREAGESFEVDIASDKAYGPRRPELKQRVSKKFFKDQKLAPGQQVVAQTQQGPRLVTVEKVGLSTVDVDLNHPMAGRDLRFAIEVLEVREAGEEELAHGHVHGDGGVQH